jgi:hypothetical protein
VSEGAQMIIARDSKYSDDPKPNWTYWRQLKVVNLNDALYLSLNINPNLVSNELEIALDFYHVEISERLSVIYSWADTESWYIGDIDEIPSKDRVDLKLFAEWAISEVCWTNLPSGFTQLVKKSSVRSESLSSWVDVAREIALEVIKSHGGEYSLTQEDVSKRVAKELDKRGVKNMHQETIPAESIRKMALTSDKWWQLNKPKRK